MIWEDPDHTCTIYDPPSAGTRDAGGGTNPTWGTVLQAAVPCLINTADASEVERFAALQIVVSHTISILSSAMTTLPNRGCKVKTDDTNEFFHVHGISKGRAFMDIPAFVYLHCQQVA